MSTIDISKNYRVYSPKQLREYAYNGILTCGKVDLTEFLEYFVTGYLDKACEEAREEGYEEGFKAVEWEGPVGPDDETLEKIEKAIQILKEI